jgi:DNA-binding PadR family transcriptional regulator
MSKEKNMNVLSILGGNAFVMFNKEIAREVSVNGAIIFGQLCSSYESFGSKSMLTVRDRKEFFYLTSEVIEEETALTYRQQVKAIKDLEEAGYIEAVIMGSPARKYFHITDKIFEQFKVSSDKSEELNETKEQENSVMEPNDDFVSYDKRAIQACIKEQSLPEQKSNAYKEIKEKEKIKNTKNNLVNKEYGNKYQEIIDKLVLEYMNKGLSKSVCFRVVNEVKATSTVKDFGAYLNTCLSNTLYKHDLKQGKIDFSERFSGSTVPFYNWLSEEV